MLGDEKVMKYFIQGLLLGISYVAPIGMQNLYVINSAMSNKKTDAYKIAFITIFFDISLAITCFWGTGELSPGLFPEEWMRLNSKINMTKLFYRCCKNGILINPGYMYDFNANYNIRISYSYASIQDLQFGLKRLSDIIRSL